jgi:DNA-binding LacI/PurR family transcriptional regulator/DNA-binding transcriptional regulator YhcF (GntR family)
MKQKKQRGPIPQWPRIAAELKQALCQDELSGPLTTRGLAKRWKVSALTMAKAVRTLVNEGILECSQGSRIRVRSDGAHQPAEHSSEARFCDLLRRRIRDGTFRVGAPLPKVNYFTLEERISPNTVVAACERLRDESLVYKRGKHWVVGKPVHSSFPGAAPAGRPVVMLLFPYSMEWRPFHTHDFLIPFSNAFTGEMQHRGITLTMAFIDKGDERTNDAGDLPIVSGAGEIVSFVKERSDRFLGTLVFCGAGPPESAAGVIGRLMAQGKPIVHFDPADTLGPWAGQFVVSNKNLFYRCHLDERAGIRLALDALAACHHTRIGVPWFSSVDAGWVRQRLDRIREAAAMMGPSPTLVFVEQREPFWHYVRTFDIREFKRQISATIDNEGLEDGPGVSSHASFRTQLLRRTPSLARLLGADGVTALLSMSDISASELYLWMRYAGVDIPRDLSMIAFDNAFSCRHFPVSTIDFGFARLGYLAAHLLFGDIPVHADRNGNIPSQPMLIDRESVAPPRAN